MFKILAIDDDESFLEAIKNFLQYKKYKVTCVASPFKALDLLKSAEFDCILSDVKMPGMDGLELLQKIQRLHPLTPVIMISGQSTISIAVNAIHQGAYDFIEKTSDSSRILITLEKAIEKKSWAIEKQNLLFGISEKYEMIGHSQQMQQVFAAINRVAPTDAKVLILGETGTGKDLVARALHNKSKRNGQKFIPVNCAAIPETLLESELFGHKKGSFTGAISDKTGKFMMADGGTLFLDEIGDLPLSLQAKLLRVLEDGEIEIIGKNETQQVDIRVISATNKNLEEMIEKGQFRRDLYHRLNVISIRIPPLNERRDDIPLLAKYFLHQNANTYNKQLLDFSPQAMEALKNFNWKGNIRQLKNLIEKISVFANSKTIQINDVFSALEMDKKISAISHTQVSLKEEISRFEKDYITRVLIENQWKIQQTADNLGIERTTLFKKMQNYGIERPQNNTIKDK